MTKEEFEAKLYEDIWNGDIPGMGRKELTEALEEAKGRGDRKAASELQQHLDTKGRHYGANETIVGTTIARFSYLWTPDYTGYDPESYEDDDEDYDDYDEDDD